MSMDEQLTVFWRHYDSETLQITCLTQCHISEYLSLQQHWCSNLTSGLAGDRQHILGQWHRLISVSVIKCCHIELNTTVMTERKWRWAQKMAVFIEDISSPHSTVLTGSDGWQQQQAWRNSSVTRRWLRIQMYRKASANKAFITIWQYISTG